MGSIGGPELLLILVLAFLLFGPRKLPEIGRSLGKVVGEFRRATQEFRTGVEREIELEKVREVKGALDEASREVRDGIRQIDAPGSDDAASRDPR